MKPSSATPAPVGCKVQGMLKDALAVNVSTYGTLNLDGVAVTIRGATISSTGNVTIPDAAPPNVQPRRRGRPFGRCRK